MPKKKSRAKTTKPNKSAASRRHKSSAKPSQPVQRISTSILSWFSVRGGARAVDFYKSAFGATEVFRLEDSGDVVARLSIDGAEFWLSDESPEHFNFSPASLNGTTIRIILTVADPDATFARALAAGATQVSAVVEENGWRVGRVVDPFGHHWEIGRPLE
jgi:PhnB protein